MRLIILGLGLIALSSCAGLTRVQPYEREHLAERSMQMPPNAINAKLDDHIYFSKEAARGGRGGGGGGCGCN